MLGHGPFGAGADSERASEAAGRAFLNLANQIFSCFHHVARHRCEERIATIRPREGIEWVFIAPSAPAPETRPALTSTTKRVLRMMREGLQVSFSSIEVVVRRRGFGYPWSKKRAPRQKQPGSIGRNGCRHHRTNFQEPAWASADGNQARMTTGRQTDKNISI